MTQLDYIPDPDPDSSARRHVFIGALTYLSGVLNTMPVKMDSNARIHIEVDVDVDDGQPTWEAMFGVVQQLVQAGGKIRHFGWGLRDDPPRVTSIDVTLGHIPFKFAPWYAVRLAVNGRFLLSDLIEAIDAGELGAAELFDLLRDAATEHGIAEFEDAVNRINLGV